MSTVVVAVVNSVRSQFIKVQGLPANAGSVVFSQLLYRLGFKVAHMAFDSESIQHLTENAALYEWVPASARAHLRRMKPTSCTLVAVRADNGPTRLVYIQELPVYMKHDDLIPALCASGFGRHCIILRDPNDDAHCPIYEWTMSASGSCLRLV